MSSDGCVEARKILEVYGTTKMMMMRSRRRMRGIEEKGNKIREGRGRKIENSAKIDG